MKKTYIAPKTETTKVQLTKMIAVSDPKVMTNPLSASEAESRGRNSNWADDEEDW